MKNVKKKKTYVVVILDKSGSMITCRDATLIGVNEKLQQFRKESEDQEIFVSFYTFDGGVYEHAFNKPAADVGDLTPEDYVPSGSTAMLDAVGYAVSKLHAETREETDDVAYLVEIISDGAENASREYTSKAVAELIKERKETKRWTFAYMGSNQDLSRITNLNIPSANVAMFVSSNSQGALGAIRAANAVSSSYLGMRGQSLTPHFEVSKMYSENEVIADFTSNSATLTADDLNTSTHFKGIRMATKVVNDISKYRETSSPAKSK